MKAAARQRLCFIWRHVLFDRIRATAALFALAVSWPALSSIYSLANLTPEQLRLEAKNGTWYHCSETGSASTWCMDELRYYKQTYFAELATESNQVQLTLLKAYSPLTLVDLQLYLRQDGFKLEYVNINGDAFDVEGRLLKSTSETETLKLDKELILFLNSYPQSVHRHMVWGNRNWRVDLTSDGEMVEVKLHSQY